MDPLKSFDMSFALSAMFLWLIFGYLGKLLNCDIQHLMTNNIYVMHGLAIVAFFFLFTVLDTSNPDRTLATVWVETIVTYGIFMMVVKSKWYFVFPAITLLLITQSLKYQMLFNTNHDKSVEKQTSQQDNSHLYKAVKILTWLNIGIIVTGFIHYGLYQFNMRQNSFDILKLVFGTTNMCDSLKTDRKT
jgi:hypothetical protein